MPEPTTGKWPGRDCGCVTCEERKRDDQPTTDELNAARALLTHRRLPVEKNEVTTWHKNWCGTITNPRQADAPVLCNCGGDGRRADAADREIAALHALLVRLRQYEHENHDKGSDEQRAKGDYGPTPVETCQHWFCYHVGVYVRDYESRNLLQHPSPVEADTDD